MVIWTAVTRGVSHSNLSLKSLTWRPECTLSCQLLQQPALVELTVVEELTVHCLEHHQWSPVSHCWRGRLSGWRWSGCSVWHFFAPLLCRSVMGLLTGNRKQSVQPCCECNEGVWSVCSGGGGCWWHPVSPGKMQSLANWTVEPLWRCDPAHSSCKALKFLLSGPSGKTNLFSLFLPENLNLHKSYRQTGLRWEKTGHCVLRLIN